MLRKFITTTQNAVYCTSYCTVSNTENTEAGWWQASTVGLQSEHPTERKISADRDESLSQGFIKWTLGSGRSDTKLFGQPLCDTDRHPPRCECIPIVVISCEAQVTQRPPAASRIHVQPRSLATPRGASYGASNLRRVVAQAKRHQQVPNCSAGEGSPSLPSGRHTHRHNSSSSSSSGRRRRWQVSRGERQQHVGGRRVVSGRITHTRSWV